MLQHIWGSEEVENPLNFLHIYVFFLFVCKQFIEKLFVFNDMCTRRKKLTSYLHAMYVMAILSVGGCASLFHKLKFHLRQGCRKTYELGTVL